jgi:hypothetical protein
MTETVTERGSSTFYLAEDAFGTIPISVAFILKLEPQHGQAQFEGGMRHRRETNSVRHRISPELSEERFASEPLYTLKETNIEKMIRLWINGSVQPILLIIDANHCFVHRNLIRVSTISRL